MTDDNSHLTRTGGVLLAVCVLLAGCGGSDSSVDSAAPTTSAESTAATTPSSATATDTDTDESDGTSGEASIFQIEVRADNWSAVYVNGQLIGEDSVPLTTERSFNAENFTFEAAYPFTVAVEAKDFKESDSGLEYIGETNQQMGDGGIIAQITDTATGEIVASTDSSWRALVIHRAPLNTNCEHDADPEATCQFQSNEAPDGWADTVFDDSAWPSATEWTAADVGPKDGYNEISWDADAELIWGADLRVDNTVLLRSTVTK